MYVEDLLRLWNFLNLGLVYFFLPIHLTLRKLKTLFEDRCFIQDALPSWRVYIVKCKEKWGQLLYKTRREYCYFLFTQFLSDTDQNLLSLYECL